MRKPARQAQWELSYRGVVPAPPGVVMFAPPEVPRNAEGSIAPPLCEAGAFFVTLISSAVD